MIYTAELKWVNKKKQIENVLVLRASRMINEVHSFEMNRIETVFIEGEPNVPCRRGIRHSDKMYPMKRK